MSSEPSTSTNGQATADPNAEALFVAVKVLQQAVDLLPLFSEDSQLTFCSNFISGSTVGKHLRHSWEHFTLLLNAISTPPPHILSYDIRTRNVPMESSLGSARSELLDLIERLKSDIPTVNLDMPVTLHAVTPFPAVYQTTIGRELWFTSLHAIHHWSVVRVVAREMGIVADDTFGVAPSTLKYRGHDSAGAKAKI